MNGANLYGYVRCKLGSRKISSVATNFFGQQMFKSVSSTCCWQMSSQTTTFSEFRTHQVQCNLHCRCCLLQRLKIQLEQEREASGGSPVDLNQNTVLHCVHSCHLPRCHMTFRLTKLIICLLNSHVAHSSNLALHSTVTLSPFQRIIVRFSKKRSFPWMFMVQRSLQNPKI